jgi:hypothetical protein
MRKTGVRLMGPSLGVTPSAWRVTLRVTVGLSYLIPTRPGRYWLIATTCRNEQAGTDPDDSGRA